MPGHFEPPKQQPKHTTVSSASHGAHSPGNREYRCTSRRAARTPIDLIEMTETLDSHCKRIQRQEDDGG
jgi:hypothetical protein